MTELDVYVDMPTVSFPARLPKLVVGEEHWREAGEGTEPGGIKATLAAEFAVNAMRFVAWAFEVDATGRPKQVTKSLAPLLEACIGQGVAERMVLRGRTYLVCVLPAHRAV